MIFKELTEKNLFLYAAKHYKNPKFADIDEFYEDSEGGLNEEKSKLKF